MTPECHKVYYKRLFVVNDINVVKLVKDLSKALKEGLSDATSNATY